MNLKITLHQPHPGVVPKDDSLDRRYLDLKELKKKRDVVVPLFKRNGRDYYALTRRIQNIREHLEKTYKHFNLCLPNYYIYSVDIARRSKVQLALDTVLSWFASESLSKALRSAGAKHIWHHEALYSIAPECVVDYGRYNISAARVKEHIDKLLVMLPDGNEDLVKALLAAGANPNAADESKRTALHVAARKNNVPVAKLLIAAGASIESKSGHSTTPFRSALGNRAWDTAQFLLELGATMDREYYVDPPEKDSYFKMLLRASVRRYAPTWKDARKEAKKALQNIATLLYIFAVRLRLPFYIVYEIILSAAGEQENANKQQVDWTLSLKKDLDLIYRYRCNGNDLLPLWRKIINCLTKDPVERNELMAKFGAYIEPFMGNEVKGIVCQSLMRKVSDEGGGRRSTMHGNYYRLNYEGELFGEDNKPNPIYFNHLRDYLRIEGINSNG